MHLMHSWTSRELIRVNDNESFHGNGAINNACPRYENFLVEENRRTGGTSGKKATYMRGIYYKGGEMSLYFKRKSKLWKKKFMQGIPRKGKKHKFIVIKRGLFLRRVRNMDNVYIYIYIQTSLAMRRTYDPSQFQQRSKRIIKRSSQSLFSSHPRSRISSLSTFETDSSRHLPKNH